MLSDDGAMRGGGCSVICPHSSPYNPVLLVQLPGLRFSAAMLRVEKLPQSVRLIISGERASEWIASGNLVPRETPKHDSQFESLAGKSIADMKNYCSRRWIACLLLLASSGSLLWAADNAPPPPAGLPSAEGTNLSLSVNASIKRAEWQQRLTLGPGDTLNLQLFNMPDTTQTEVPIGPDGGISFLQARDIMAAGLTIDELRAKMDEALAKFYQNPRSIITPAAYHSKKYVVLGAVANRGVYQFDRPLSVIEALARAGGVQTGVYGRDTIELADLGRSFLVRNGQRVPADFERLFEQGDLSQNVPLAAGRLPVFCPS